MGYTVTLFFWNFLLLLYKSLLFENFELTLLCLYLFCGSLASWFLKFGVSFRNLSRSTFLIVVTSVSTASAGWYARDEFGIHLEGRSRGPIWGTVRHGPEAGKENQEHRHWVRIADLQAEIWTGDRSLSSNSDLHWIAT